MKKILIIFILSLILISGCGQKIIYQETNSNTENIKKETSLNDIVKIGDLSFKLLKVGLQKWEENKAFTTEVNGNILAKIYSMFWIFEVINKGESIEYITNCGTLLFEDGSQYDFNIQTPTTRCRDYKIIPGATIKIISMFQFDDSYLYKGSAKPWEQVPGSKITYFSEQSDGLIRYVMDKSEIEYTEEKL